jgi:superoxide dismutase, Fe-Mn family
MLFVYGPYLPIRVLEEIRFWKQQEKEHVDVIKAIVPALEPVYVKLLNDWAKVFADTESAADSLLQYALSAPPQTPPDPELVKQAERLLAASSRQSQEWIRQLDAILQQSQAVQTVPLAKVVLLHIIRESEYFLAVLETLNRPGLLAQAASQVPPAPDPYHLLPPAGSDRYSRKLDQQISREKGERTAITARSLEQRVREAAVPIGGHQLPPLPYPYNALEPHIDELTVRIHHDKHHLAYVEDLNKAEKKLEEARATGNFDLVKHWERELAFNGAGHYLHTIYWDTMNPRGGGRPSGALAAQIERDFGSYEAFHNQFTEAAKKVEGGGWTILVWSPRAHRLEILQAEKHQNLSQWDVVPLLPIDVWEHSYYLKHQNNRAAYIQDWWNVVYWPAVMERFMQARQLQWKPY